MTNTHFSRFENGEEPAETVGMANHPTAPIDPQTQALGNAAEAAEKHREIVGQVPKELQKSLDTVLGTDGKTFVYLTGLMGALERGLIFGDTDLSAFALQSLLNQRKSHMLQSSPGVKKATLEIENFFGVDLDHADPNETLSLQGVNSVLAHDAQKYIATKTDFLWAMDSVRRHTNAALRHEGGSSVNQAA